jgi:ubiquinone/menaquinone biosynthesis C-methylase UbiE
MKKVTYKDVVPSKDIVFSYSPIEVIDGIPVFSVSDFYIKNYQKIASDHMKIAFSEDIDNPFMEDETWQRLDDSTRSLIKKYSKTGDKVLDVGVGLGRVLSSFAELDRYGIDISLDYLSIAKKNGIEVALSSVDDMPFPDDAFDLVISCDVIEHVVDLHSCYQQMVRVLKPGGILIIRAPFNENLEVYLDYKEYDFVHVRSLSLEDLVLPLTKFYGMTYREHTLVEPYLKESTFKVNLLAADSPLIKLANESQGDESPLWGLKNIAGLTDTDFKNWFYALKTTHPELYDLILPDLINCLEFNTVFQKNIMQSPIQFGNKDTRREISLYDRLAANKLALAEAQLEDATSEVEALMTQLSGAASQSFYDRVAAKRFALVEAQLQGAKSEIDVLMIQLSEAGSQFSNNVENLATANESLVSTKEELATAHNVMGAAEQERVIVEAELATAHDSLGATKEELESTKLNLFDAQEELATAHNVMDAAEQERVIVEAELATAHDSLGATKEELESTKLNLFDAQEELATAHNVMDAAEQERVIVEAELATAHDSLGATKEELESAKLNLSDTQKELYDTEHEKISLQEKVQSFEEQMVIVSLAQREINEKNIRIRLLEGQLVSFKRLVYFMFRNLYKRFF